MDTPLDHSKLHRDAIFLLSGAARLIQRDFERRSKAFGTNRAQWQVLASLLRSQGQNQISLAEKLDMTPIVLARIIDRLEEGDYVERRPDPGDRRARLLFLTDRAEPLIQQMRTLGSETGELAFDGLADEEIVQLVELLGRLCSNLSDKFEVGDLKQQSSRKGG